MNLNDPISLGSLTLSGRIVMPPMATAGSDEQGYVTDALIDYYRKRAKNPHVALIITEHCFICPQGQASARQMSVADDACIPGLQRLVEAIHEGGAKAVCQINHAGSIAAVDEPVAPSAVAHPRKRGMTPPAALTEHQIADIVAAFAAAAQRAKAAGYDAVEIHSAHGYLLNQFYSPLTNHREDAYGGSLEHRLRIHCEVIRAVRAAVGEDYPVFLRLGGCDYCEGGSSVQDCAEAAKILSGEGIALLDLTGGMNGYVIPGHSEPGYFAELSRAAKAVTTLPVLLTGGVKTLAEAQALLSNGAADCIGVGRALLQAADWER